MHTNTIKTKIEALGIFNIANTDFLNAVNDTKREVDEIDKLLIKLTAQIVKGAHDLCGLSISRSKRESFRHYYSFRRKEAGMTGAETESIAWSLLRMGYDGGNIICVLRYNAGQNRYIYTFYF